MAPIRGWPSYFGLNFDDGLVPDDVKKNSGKRKK